MCFATLYAKEPQSEILFDKTVHNFGKFTDANPVVTCKFVFKNVGEASLIINQAMASCGCTDPEYPKTPIQPGEKGQVKVTYNGVGKSFGHFRKFVTFMTNGNPEKVKIYIEGDMEESK